MAEKHSRLGKGLNSIFGSGTSKNPDAENLREAVEPEYSTEKKIYREEANSHSEGNSTYIAERKVLVDNSTDSPENKDGQLQSIKINLVQPRLDQPRQNFSEEALWELSESIKKYGVLQPVLVRRQGALYEIIAGERRWRAAKRAGLKELPVIISDIDDRKVQEVAIIENIQRADLNALEEAQAYQRLISDYGLTQEELSERLSKSRSAITNILRLLKLEPEIQDMLRDGVISQGHGRALLMIEDSSRRLDAAKKCAEEGLSVRELEKLAKGAEKPVSRSKGNPEMQRLRLIYKELEGRMKQRLGTKVSIVPKNEKSGRLEIEYYSQEELDRIYMLLNREPET